MPELALRELTLLSVPIRILVAIILSGIIGLERGMKNRAAGFRTYMLVCIGSCIVMMTNQYVQQVYGTGDPVRLGAQVVSGIGFLGAGTIIVTSRNQIKGLTTAAGLWASACIGLAIGIGFYEVAAVGGIAVFLVLTVLHSWEDFMRRNAKILTVYIELHVDVSVAVFLQQAREHELNLSNLQLEQDHTPGQTGVSFLVTVKRSGKSKKEETLQMVRTLPSVQFMEEL